MTYFKASFGFVFLLALALSAFAANSLLTRVALGEQLLDAASFTLLRIVSAILMLRILLVFLQPADVKRPRISLKLSLPSVYLSVYALCFSYAYISLSTGTGAIILFTCVQMSMLFINYLSGERLSIRQVLGVLLAFSGFIYLMLPTLRSPSLFGFVLMSIAGIAWGLYSISGRQSQSALVDTYGNFLQSWPWLIVLLIFSANTLTFSWQGMILAIASGALASALGYALWFMIVKRIAISSAAVLQLLVPVLASMAGWLFYHESLSVPFLVASSLILIGLLLVVLRRT